jgi:hypothetical protein
LEWDTPRVEYTLEDTDRVGSTTVQRTVEITLTAAQTNALRNAILAAVRADASVPD